MSRRQLVLASK